MFNFENKVVVVTGAGSGIGWETCKRFLDAGAKVVGADLDPELLADIQHDRFQAVACDLGTQEGCDQVVNVVLDTHAKLDVLINNVGIFPYRGGFLNFEMSDWLDLFSVNFFSAVRLLQQILPVMCDQKSGVIVSVTSDLARQPDFRLADYSASKAALLNLNKCVANEFGSCGIRCNVVAPGPIRTAQWDVPGGFADKLAAEFGLSKEDAIKHFVNEVRKIPVGQIGEAADVANLILYLSSDYAKQITGTEFGVNGGIYAAA